MSVGRSTCGPRATRHSLRRSTSTAVADSRRCATAARQIQGLGIQRKAVWRLFCRVRRRPSSRPARPRPRRRRRRRPPHPRRRRPQHRRRPRRPQHRRHPRRHPCRRRRRLPRHRPRPRRRPRHRLPRPLRRRSLRPHPRRHRHAIRCVTLQERPRRCPARFLPSCRVRFSQTAVVLNVPGAVACRSACRQTHRTFELPAPVPAAN
mmetsp:Transcript_26704/g.79843  ORF Transcript_26704/g.79843 Transcript_26704/m.79843 type:complete len:206 (-) Transcript_26704:124-741(-)